MEVWSEYFRCVSNPIYSYVNIHGLVQVPVLEGEEDFQGSRSRGLEERCLVDAFLWT